MNRLINTDAIKSESTFMSTLQTEGCNTLCLKGVDSAVMSFLDVAYDVHYLTDVFLLFSLTNRWDIIETPITSTTVPACEYWV